MPRKAEKQKQTDHDAAGVEFRCRDVGVACQQVTRADSPDELVQAVAAHARDKHGVELNATLLDYALTKVRTS